MSNNTWLKLRENPEISLGILAYSGMVYDDVNHSILLFGGGHNDYWGNEVYKFNFSTLNWVKLYEPTPCAEYATQNYDASRPGMLTHVQLPMSRHTYDQLAYASHVNRLFIHSGFYLWDKSCMTANPSTASGNDTWLFDPVGVRWEYKSPTLGTSPGGSYATNAAYDPVTKKVYFLHGGSGTRTLYAYTPETNTWQSLSTNSNLFGIEYVMVYNSGARSLDVVDANGAVHRYLIDQNAWTSKTPATKVDMTGQSLAYDPVNDVLIAYTQSGLRVYNWNTNQWTTPTPSGAPSPQWPLWPHFVYDPIDNVFIASIYGSSGNVETWAYKYQGSAAPPPSDTTAPTVSLTAPSQGSTVADTVTVSASASDNVGVSRVEFYVDGVLKSTDTSSPYSFSWDTTNGGTHACIGQHTHTLSAKAVDSAGNVGTSADVLVYMNDPSYCTVTPPPSTKFQLNDRVEVSSGPLNVRSTPSTGSTILGTQATGALGTIVGGPTYADGFHWWNVNYDSGADGWSVEDFLVKVTTTPHPSSTNTVTIHNTSGVVQTNRPVSIARPTKQGGIPQCYSASVGGTSLLTQTDIKNRWPDGSVKFAIVSFVVPSLPANGSVTVSFSNQANCNNTGYLTQSQMLDSSYNFDAVIDMAGSQSASVSARQMLADGHFTYWLQGPVVTAVTIETKTPAREYDRKVDSASGNPLHPIFDVWFYPQNKTVDIGYTMENAWAGSNQASSMRDQTYSLVLKSGQTNPTTEFTHPSFKHIGKTIWHKRFWLGATDPGKIRVDHNLAYLAGTRMVPTFDANNQITESAVASSYNDWTSADKTIDGNGTETGNYPGDTGRTTTAGASPWIWMHHWYVLYLRTMDDRMLEQTLGNADLGGRLPIYIREADTLAGTGDYFNRQKTVDTFGKVFSVFARPSNGLRDINFGASTGDQYNLGSISLGAGTGPTHQPRFGDLYVLTGDPYHLRQAQYNGAFMVGFRQGSCGIDWARCGYTVPSMIIEDESRGAGHSLDITAFTAMVSPDGSPEKQYFDEMMQRGIAGWEGILNLSNSYPAYQDAWDFGRNVRSKSSVIWGNFTTASPLGHPRRGIGSYSSDSMFTGSNPPVSEADASWGFGFFANALGNAKQYNYPTDKILQFVAPLYLNIMLNPAVNQYVSEAYVWPTTVTEGGQARWVGSWSEFENLYTQKPSGCYVSGGGTHSYRLIFGGALSRLYDYTASGYTGQNAWNKFASMCSRDQSEYGSGGAQWAILPLSLVATGSQPPPPQPLVGDLNQDGTVNASDWSIMASQWFTSDPVADLNKDGIVNSIDFSLMNQNWGKSE